MRDVFITLIILAPLPLVVSRPHLGVLLWLWISYMNPHRFAWGFAYGLPFSMVVGMVTFVAWFISREPKRLPMTATTVLLIAFALWFSFTTIFALSPDLAFSKWDRTIKIMLGAFLTLGLMQGRERIDALVWVTAGSIAVFGIKGGVFAILTGGNYRVFGPTDSFIEDNNYLAAAMLMVCPLLRYLNLNASRRWIRIGLVSAMALTLLSVLASYSRGATVGLAAAAVVFWLKSERKLLVGAAIAAAIVAALNFMPGQWFDRMQSTADYNEDASAQGRFDAWRHALAVVADRPVIGGGFRTFSPDVFEKYSPGVLWRDAHSIYFEVLGEQGYLGLGLFLTIWIVTYCNGTWIRKRARDRAELKWAADLAAMLQVSLVGYAVCGLFASLSYFDLYFGLVVIMSLTRLSVAKALGESGIRAGRRTSSAEATRLGSLPVQGPSS